MLALLICLLLSLVHTSSPPQPQNSRPQFRDFQVRDIYRGAPARPIITKEWRMMRTRIRQGANHEVQFAGHYTVPGWGCGTGCGAFVIVDSITGRIYDSMPAYSDFPVRWFDNHPPVELMEFHPDSRLLKINGCPNETNCGFYDYEMIEGRGLKLLRREPLPPEFQFPP
jgi:hypothetical protein